ncbi:MAG TPA: response regulator transcription factor [Acidimicrobiales bacterium]|nr:response regulator transcription factor [Acidimicrobiales bacterium]
MEQHETTIGVFLLDDHEVVREGLRHLLETETDIRVVGEAGTGQEAIDVLDPTVTQVAVLDVRLPDMSGVEVCREIRSRYRHVACLMLTSFTDDEAMFDAVMAGASGYILKEVRGSDLVNDIRRVATGHSLLDPALTARVLERVRQGPPARPEDLLTAQERKILDLIAEGMTNRQISEVLFLSEKTVKNYVSNMLSKLGMSRRTEAAVYAVRHGHQEVHGAAR